MNIAESIYPPVSEQRMSGRSASGSGALEHDRTVRSLSEELSLSGQEELNQESLNIKRASTCPSLQGLAHRPLPCHSIHVSSFSRLSTPSGPGCRRLRRWIHPTPGSLGRSGPVGGSGKRHEVRWTSWTLHTSWTPCGLRKKELT